MNTIIPFTGALEHNQKRISKIHRACDNAIHLSLYNSTGVYRTSGFIFFKKMNSRQARRYKHWIKVHSKLENKEYGVIK